ncbi:MAG: putative ATP-dependent helicase [Candidatus Tokpelaia sp. JSC189]|nr:MAG: putative ATP-dependent helicase [Candidatus Tokpelaia sp. JSC189]
MMIDVQISLSGDVLFEGYYVGRLEDFRFSADNTVIMY